MKFLADESCDFSVIHTLRQSGFDVKAIAEISPRAEDLHVINFACNEKRILITEDKDFGQLVYAYGQGSQGVIFIRYPSPGRQKLPSEILSLVNLHGQKLESSFTVVQPGRVRIDNLPI